MNGNETRLIASDGGKHLCKSCAALNYPDADFCVKCGAPLSPYSTVGPFESIFAQGFVYRKAAENPRRFIVVLGIWLLFLPGLLGVVIIGNSGALFDVAGGGLALLSLGIIARTTWNYLATKKPATVDKSRQS